MGDHESQNDLRVANPAYFAGRCTLTDMAGWFSTGNMERCGHCVGIFSSFASGHCVGIGSHLARGHCAPGSGETARGSLRAISGRCSCAPLPSNGEAKRWLASMGGAFHRRAVAEPNGSGFACGAAHGLEVCAENRLQAVHGCGACCALPDSAGAGLADWHRAVR